MWASVFVQQQRELLESTTKVTKNNSDDYVIYMLLITVFESNSMFVLNVTSPIHFAA